MTNYSNVPENRIVRMGRRTYIEASINFANNVTLDKRKHVRVAQPIPYTFDDYCERDHKPHVGRAKQSGLTYIDTLIALVAVMLIVALFNQPYDSTDDAESGTRSGLTLHIDHGTGCEYLVARGFFGLSASITPRLDSNGAQVCNGARK